MYFLEKKTKESIEIDILINFLKNRGESYSQSLINPMKEEPTDIDYNGEKYQITIGDRDEIQKRRKATSRFQIYSSIRSIDSKIVVTLLESILESKAKKSDKNTVLLIQLEGGDYLEDIFIENLSLFTKENNRLFYVWKNVYAVFPNKNIIIK